MHGNSLDVAGRGSGRKRWPAPSTISPFREWIGHHPARLFEALCDHERHGLQSLGPEVAIAGTVHARNPMHESATLLAGFSGIH